MAGYRRQIARKQARLRASIAMAVAFDGETAHALDQMTSQIDPGAALGAWIIGIETNERVLRRNGQRDFEMGKQDIIGDSGHGPMRTNKEL